ncbi:uncharacterized protein LOC111861520 [Cryptotermes secundus]|uniref:uncharacterized protein LOC111861520 n=1 Tax=Cryptotermes secundus TaxID=105785 RepID=UPI001454DEAF|nr:uncharacterized protein LOC111861520 [Cryptotermes secundus]
MRDTRPGLSRFPPYRCALYREESGTGNVFMAFSSDSTCSSNLRSATAGYETLSLSVMPAPRWPSQVDSSNCRFPQWAHGYWQHMYIEGNALTYKDHTTFKTFTIRCLGPDLGVSERFPVFARTQCGEEMYTCIWLKRRGVNVLEFQLGLQSSTYYNSTLCSDTNFEPKIWITQGRLERLQESPCPVAGEYTGVIPDATNLCAKLSSDCKSPEIMYYMVSDCSQSEIYEGIRRRGRNRRQTGTRIYRISNPHTSTTPLPTFTHFPFSQSNNETNLKKGDKIQQDQSNSEAGKSSRLSGPQQDHDPGHKRSHYSYYKGPSSRYPTSYHIGSSSTTLSPLDSQHEYLEEEYDPWTFSKTHGHQADSHKVTQHHGTEYSSHLSENNRNPAWASASYYGTSSNSKSESGGKQQDQTYGPRSQWNRQSTSMGSTPGVGMVSNTYSGDRIFRNNNPQGSPSTSSSFSGPYRDTSFSHNKSSQNNQRTVNSYSGPHANTRIAYGDSSHGTQRIGGSHYGSDSGSGFHYNENLPVSHSIVGNYPGSGEDWGSSYNENSQVTQRTVERYSGSNKNLGLSHSEDRSLKSYSRSNINQDFSQHDHVSPSSYSASNNNQGFPYNEQRPPDGYLVTNRNQGFPHNEHRPPSGYSESNRDHTFSHNEHRSPSAYSGPSRGQSFDQNENSHRNGGSYADYSVSQVSSSSEPVGSHRNHGLSVERGASSENHGTYRTVIQNAGKHVFRTEDHNHDMGFPNTGLDQKAYPRRVTEVRDQERNVNGQQHAITHDISSTVHWEERLLSQNHWNNNVSTQPFKATESRHHGLEGSHSILKPDPVQFLPIPVQRPRHGDRPSTVPRTATLSKREEREYRCLGQWEEDGLMYTYTHRRDVGTYECFVGSIISNNEIYIKEAGDHCQRNIDPMHYGMKLTRKGTCFGNQPNAGAGAFPQPHPTTPWMSSRRPPEPTKPWKPITAPPREASGADGHQNSASIPLLSMMIVIFVYFCQH